MVLAYVTNVLGEDEHVQNEVHALLFRQDHRVCELRKHFSFLFTPVFEDFSAAQPFLLQQVNNRLVHDFLSQQNNRLFLFLSELMQANGFICGWKKKGKISGCRQGGDFSFSTQQQWRTPPSLNPWSSSYKN